MDIIQMVSKKSILEVNVPRIAKTFDLIKFFEIAKRVPPPTVCHQELPEGLSCDDMIRLAFISVSLHPESSK